MTESTTHNLPDPTIIPIKALRMGSRNLISSLLNPPKIIPNDNGIPRDWRGLAHLIGLRAERIPVIACDSDPTARVLSLWTKEGSTTCTVQHLRLFLAELDRYDIIEDTKEIIGKQLNYMRAQNHVSLPVKNSFLLYNSLNKVKI